MTSFGYLRVSTSDGRQNVRSQRAAVKSAGATDFREEQVSGSKSAASRPVLNALLAEMAAGDTLVVFDWSRLSRSLSDLLTITKSLHERGIILNSTQQGILDPNNPSSVMMLGIIGSVNQFQNDLQRIKTYEGIAAARARGKFGGRPLKLTPAQVTMANKLRAENHSVASIGSLLNVSRPTIYRALAKVVESPAA
jgi:DNA invertase Pin-like site-specific DNA recombinase